ncbi:MAG: flagellar biosynthesis protein FlgA [Actinomycetota bacterium]|nr:flagellar biosynthesis protein FlgA [Actinomycetota bacterium]
MELATPTVTRLARPRWLDPRLLLGAFLVLLSVVLGAKVVAEADDTVPVWSVTEDVAPHTVLTAEVLRSVDVQLRDASSSYISARDAGPVGYVATRELRAGELLPAGGVAPADLADKRRVTVEVPHAVADGLVRSAVVDVYVVPDDRGAGSGASPRRAQRVLEGVPVAGEPAGGGLRGGARGTVGIELLVPQDRVEQLLTDLATGTPALVEVPKLRADSDPTP